jgi:hypothetical protein
VEADRLGDDVTHLHARVHRSRDSGTPSASGGAGGDARAPFQGGEIDPLEDNLAGVGRIEPGDGTGDGGLAGARLPHQTESLTLEDLEADVVAGAHVLAAAREDGILGDELQIHVLHPQQRAFIGALVLTLAEPVGLEIDAGIRRTGILDIGDQGSAPASHPSGAPPR